ncbi:MAG TPA: M1 family metallopeptidase [Verrucomicrobiae bacterium]|nr:M1 family metallopeptidase [Verrucomicrobiae bacterium]
MARPDPHSYFEPEQPRTKHVLLDLEVDFERRVLAGTARLTLASASGGRLDLDTKLLTVRSVSGADGRPIPFALEDEQPILGRRLRLDLPKGTIAVVIAYETSPDSTALQWLEPRQTSGRRHPFLFSQCQAIHAREISPLQDSPGARLTYSASLTVPEPLAAVMSAGPAGDGPGPRPGTHTWRFEMPQPIPPYLLALAVGDLASRDLSPRSRVWAEPGTVGKAAWEFAGIEDMLRTAEGLFGPYDWERYDMLVLPPSFPFGGMENPRMTFLTPTLLAGDRSLVDVVAHELAHSWTGNLVTNTSNEHFWLNEGTTVYAERRIHEALHGAEAAALAWAIGEKVLAAEFERFAGRPEMTRLRLDLDGVDPDEAFSSIPYEKGARLWALLERTAGRERFDPVLRRYIERFRFTSITTEEWERFIASELPGIGDTIGMNAWLREPGLPANAPRFAAPTLERLSTLAAGWTKGVRPPADAVKSWGTSETLVYLQRLPRPLAAADCTGLDQALRLGERGNYEILVEWLSIAAVSAYAPAFDRIREVLTTVGRMKYLRPIYTALGRSETTRALARDIFAAARPGYHPMSRRTVESILEKY